VKVSDQVKLNTRWNTLGKSKHKNFFQDIEMAFSSKNRKVCSLENEAQSYNKNILGINLRKVNYFIQQVD